MKVKEFVDNFIKPKTDYNVRVTFVVDGGTFQQDYTYCNNGTRKTEVISVVLHELDVDYVTTGFGDDCERIPVIVAKNRILYTVEQETES